MANQSILSARIPTPTRTPISFITPIAPSSLSGLSLWLKADSGVYSDAGVTLATDGQTVQQWNDQSGNANNVVQATSGNRPTYKTSILNGLPALLNSNANSSVMTVADNVSLDLSTGGTIIAVVMPLNSRLLSTQGIIAKDTGGTITNPPYDIEILLNVTATSYRGTHTNTANSVATCAGGSPSILSPSILVFTINPGVTNNIMLNGTQIATVTAAATDIGITSGDLRIGAQKSGFARSFDGYMLEYMIYKNKMLSTTERKGIESYVAKKWGINTANTRGGVNSSIRTAVS